MIDGDPGAAALLLAASLCIIAASLTVCYTIWQLTWEGWESWNARTGLDADRADDERARRRTERERH